MDLANNELGIKSAKILIKENRTSSANVKQKALEA